MKKKIKDSHSLGAVGFTGAFLAQPQPSQIQKRHPFTAELTDFSNGNYAKLFTSIVNCHCLLHISPAKEGMARI